jgi:hypothetical protein
LSLLDLEDIHSAKKDMEVTLMMDGGITKGLLGLLARRVNYALVVIGPSSFSVEWES